MRTSCGAAEHIEVNTSTQKTYGGVVERKERINLVARNRSINKRKTKKMKKKIF
jgi:hypothetical protein